MFDFLHLFDGEGGAVGGEAGADSSAATAQSATESSESAENGVATQEKTFTQSDVENIVKGRLKNTSGRLAEAEERLNSYAPLMDALRARFGTDDIATITDSIYNDEPYIASEAEKRGLSPDATRTVLRLEREKARLEEAQAQEQRDREWRDLVQRWRSEEAKLQEEFPNFSLDTEFENPTFRTLLSNGISVRNAYMGLHADDIIQGSIQYAVEKGKEIASDNIRAGASRPRENALSSRGNVATRKRVSEMTDKEFADLEKAVKRSGGTGRHITL